MNESPPYNATICEVPECANLLAIVDAWLRPRRTLRPPEGRNNAKSLPMLLHAAGFDEKAKLLKKKLRGFSSDRESMTLERIQHVAGDSRYALQIIPTLERTILRTMLDDFAGMLSADALNGRE